MHEKTLDLMRFLDLGTKSYKLKRKLFFLVVTITSKNFNLIKSQKNVFLNRLKIQKK